MGATIVGAVVLLAGCDIVDDALIPTLTGEDPAGKPAAEEQVAAPASTAGSTTQTTALSGPATGTTVGQRVQSLRSDVVAMQRSVNAENADYQRLRQSSNDQINQYRQLVGNTQTKLQLGTTAGNPELVGSLNDARGALDQLSDNVEQMTVLSKRVADDRSMASFILQSIDATFALSGAVDADHAQLKVLEDETKRTQVLVDRLTTELNSDIPNQSNFVAREQASLAALNAAVAVGKLPDAGPAPASTPPAAAAASAPAPAANLATRRPFVVIRFDRDDVAYEEPLFNAVQKALDRRPSAVFDLVSVVPSQGDAAVAERNAERVMRSLTDMGLPSERISLSALSSNETTSNEVQVFVR
ncbi:MAG: hypothetical protein OER92_09540 [Alphaproteobacteria bacterium]|nr:hypothetical protein [Alphaproteobacteria bacterium]